MNEHFSFNKNFQSGIDENGIPIKGDPETFYGTGIVVFIDLLGFSAYTLNNWGDNRYSPIMKLLRIKEAPSVSDPDYRIKFGIYSTDSSGEPIYHYQYRCKIRSFSDSVFLFTAIPANYDSEALFLAFHSIFRASISIWLNAIEEGFTVRGGLELGDIFWNSEEIIGPAFIWAHELEKHAKTSRIIIGERFINTLLFTINNLSKIQNPRNVGEDILPFLMKSVDDFISLNSRFLAHGMKNEMKKEDVIKRIKELQAACVDERLQEKYDELILTLCEPEKVVIPQKQDLECYLNILKKSRKYQI